LYDRSATWSMLGRAAAQSRNVVSSQVRRTQGIPTAYEPVSLGSGVQTVCDTGACAKSHLLANPGGVLPPLPPRAKEVAPQGEKHPRAEARG